MAVVLGLGESGLAMARWLYDQGAQVRVLDSRAEPPGRADLATHCPRARLLTGDFRPDDLQDAALLAWSPGVSPWQGPARTLHETALASAVPVVGEVELFAEVLRQARLRDGYEPAIALVTGTNGKTTVTELVAALARADGRDAVAAGNISPGLLDTWREREAMGQRPDVWVLELSSFQLAFGSGLPCHASVVLNVTEDHLDWHPDGAHYRACKMQIHRQTRCRVVNADDPLTDPLHEAAPDTRFAPTAQTPTLPGSPSSGPDVLVIAPGQPRAFAERQARLAQQRREQQQRQFWLDQPVLTFGMAMPAGTGLGCAPQDGIEWLLEVRPAEESTSGSGRRARGTAAVGGACLPPNRLLPRDALRLRGGHNVANALAALALGRALGLSMARMLHALRVFTAGPHRCAPVLVLHDVEYIDDSKGTNVGATAAALQGMGRICVLIAGGLGKGQDFAPLAPAVRRHARAVVLFGQDAPVLQAALQPAGIPLHPVATLQEAVQQAAALAQPGDVVLLSPACASQDQFRHYRHRAEVFIEAVRRMAEDEGQPC